MSGSSSAASRGAQSTGFLVASLPQASEVSVRRMRWVYLENGNAIASMSQVIVATCDAARANFSVFGLAHASSYGLQAHLSDGTTRTYRLFRQQFGGAYAYGTGAFSNTVGSPVSFDFTVGQLLDQPLPTHRQGMIRVVTQYVGMGYNGGLDNNFVELQAVASHVIDHVYTQVYHDWLEAVAAYNRGGDLYVGSYDQYGFNPGPDPRTQPFRR